MSHLRIFSGKVQKRSDIRNTSITLNTNIFSEDITPVYYPNSFFTVYACFQAAGILKVMRTFIDLGVTGTELMNEGNALAANAAYIFAFPTNENETINLQFSTSTTATKILLLESQVE